MVHKTKKMSGEHFAVLKQLAGLSGIPLPELMDNRPTPKSDGVDPIAVSVIILEELSLTLSDVVNFIPEVALLKEGRVYQAYMAVMAKCDRIIVVDAVTAWAKAQAKAAISKLDIPELDPVGATVKLWWQDEAQCKRTNAKLRAWHNRHVKLLADADTRPPRFLREVERMREYIAYVLGDSPDIDRILSSSRYGPGTSVDVRGDATHYADKLLSWDICPGKVAEDLAIAALALDKGAWELIGFDPREAMNPTAIEGFKREARKNLSVTPFDRLLFVFKKATAARTITVQPTLSGMIQLGVDSLMKDHLRTRARIDLTDQVLNQRLAREGSKFWHIADPWCTVDFSSASNLVCKYLISFSFPAEWSKLMWAVRTPLYQTPPEMGGERHAYEMYSGMGNGTTFGVESLIFGAIAYAVGDGTDPATCNTPRTFNVYGDDVVIRRSAYQAFVKFAEYMGFRINLDKSFSDGKFRESCGADYWDGINIRPAYVKGERKLNELELVGIHNTIMDSRFFVLLNAAKRIRALWTKTWPWPIPSASTGGSGFRTTSAYCWEHVPSNKYSTVWHRPRGFVIETSPGKDRLSGLTPHVSLNVVLLGGSQRGDRQEIGEFSMSLRRSIKIRVVPEMDLRKKDLLTMLGNQLRRLVSRKLTTWYNVSRGK